MEVLETRECQGHRHIDGSKKKEKIADIRTLLDYKFHEGKNCVYCPILYFQCLAQC